MNPALRDAEPLIIGGGARCGTRFVASCYAKHPDIQLQGEIHPPAMERAIEFLEDLDAMYSALPEHRQSRAGGWRTYRRDLLYSLWVGLTAASTPVEQLVRPVRFLGMKTPRHDAYWRFYRDFLGDEVRWVVCVRDFVGHYLSVTSMFGGSIDPIADSYRQVIARAEQMRAELGNRVSIFVLNDLDGVDYVKDVLFDRLNIPVDADTLERIDTDQRVNSTTGAGKRRRTELTDDERAYLRENPDLLDAVDRVRELAASGETA